MPDPLPFPLSLDRPLVFLDLETTGLRIGTDRIIELAVIRLAPNGDVTEKVRRFNPEMPIPPEATAVHGIRNEDVVDEPPFPARARSLARLLEACDLAGFNLRGFDLPMLLAEFNRAGVSFPFRDRRLVDVQTVFHREERRDLSAAVRLYLGRELEDAHSALTDTRAAAQVLAAQLERYPHLPRDIDELHQYCDEFRPFETEVDQWFSDAKGANPIFRRGKHKGVALSTVVSEAPDYLRWMLSTEDMDAGVKQIVSRALDPAGNSTDDGAATVE